MLSGKYAWRIILIFFCVSLICVMAYIAGARKIGVDNDSLMYAYIVKDSFEGNVTSFLSKEPGFWLIVYLNKLINGNVGTFFTLYAFIALVLKIWGMYKVSPSFPVSFILYVGLYFIVHEMMQIRIGLASGFIFFIFYFLVTEKKSKAIGISIISVLFHYSTVIAFLFFFVRPRKMIGKFYIILPILGGLAGFIIKANPSIASAFFNIMPEFISYKASLYFDLVTSGKLDDVKPVAIGFGSVIYYILMVFMFFRVKNKSLDDAYYRALNFILKITSAQLFLGFLLMFNVEFSNRVYTYIGVLTFVILPAFFIKEFAINSRFMIFMIIVLYAARQLYTSYNGVFA
ncbi:EpsG family protein [Klebsiella michiganensis]|nr:EpsG family protein [Klebsiella michiganensis]